MPSVLQQENKCISKGGHKTSEIRSSHGRCFQAEAYEEGHCFFSEEVNISMNSNDVFNHFLHINSQ